MLDIHTNPTSLSLHRQRRRCGRHPLVQELPVQPHGRRLDHRLLPEHHRRRPAPALQDVDLAGVPQRGGQGLQRLLRGRLRQGDGQAGVHPLRDCHPGDREAPDLPDDLNVWRGLISDSLTCGAGGLNGLIDGDGIEDYDTKTRLHLSCQAGPCTNVIEHNV